MMENDWLFGDLGSYLHGSTGFAAGNKALTHRLTERALRCCFLRFASCRL